MIVAITIAYTHHGPIDDRSSGAIWCKKIKANIWLPGVLKHRMAAQKEAQMAAPGKRRGTGGLES